VVAAGGLAAGVDQGVGEADPVVHLVEYRRQGRPGQQLNQLVSQRVRLDRDRLGGERAEQQPKPLVELPVQQPSLGVELLHLRLELGADLRDRPLDNALAVPLVSQVAGHGDAGAPALAHHTCGLLRIVIFVQIRDQHIRALSREGDGNGPANAAITPGDDRLFVEQATATTIGMLAEVRPRSHLRLAAGVQLALVRIRRPRLGNGGI